MIGFKKKTSAKYKPINKLLKYGCFLVVLFISLFAMTFSASAYESSYQGSNMVDKEGWFYLSFTGDGRTSNYKIKVTRSSAPSWSTFRDSATTYNFTIQDIGTTYHDLKFSNGTKSCTSTTKPDVYGYYYIFNLDFTYNIKGHYRYVSGTYDMPDIDARMNFKYYAQDNSGDINTIYENSKHKSYDRTVSFHMQVNAAHCGIKTYSKYWYNSKITANLGIDAIPVTQTHWIYNGSSGAWSSFETNDHTRGDGNIFTPYNSSNVPYGYTPANKYEIWKNGVNVGTYNIGTNYPVCTDSKFDVHVLYNPWTHYVAFNKNTTDSVGNMPSTQTKKYSYALNIPGNVPTRTGYTFTGWNTKADGTGTSYSPGQNYSPDYNGGTVTLYAQWTANSYTNTVAHWMGGFKNNEGNNGSKTQWQIGVTSFTSKYNTTFKMDSSKAKTVPKGYTLTSSFGISSITGNWQTLPIGTNVTQKLNGMYFEYYYEPVTYTISYNMNGGTNNSANPTTYNVLYGVTLQNPTRKGWTFDGWFLNGKKVTGINVGANASFTSESDMYNKLNSRTTGNLTLEARWHNDPPVLGVDIDDGNPDGNAIPPIIKDDDTIVIQQNDKFTPSKYIDATDTESGEKLDMEITNKVPLDDENRAYQSGTFDVIYKATDEGGASTIFTLHVIVNEPPKITATDRIFFKGQQNIDTKELLRKVVAEDKEDGSLTDKVKIESIDYQNGKIDKNVSQLDTSKTGEFIIKYTVTDQYKKTVTKTAKILVVDNQSIINSGTNSTIRFINYKYLNTLNLASIWKEEDYYEVLLKSLNENEPVQYSQSKIQAIQED